MSNDNALNELANMTEVVLNGTMRKLMKAIDNSAGVRALLKENSYYDTDILSKLELNEFILTKELGKLATLVKIVEEAGKENKDER